ncbi:MAG: efflux RND transporter permease subunit, partial [Candidatus Competibacteraceae bacterium]|nr:efflux RND transporter permease subunit [Candidatus Competibacteraceae bacterium]
GGNVVTMGELVQQRLRELQPQTPLGMELHTIAYQAKAVTAAINNFAVSLAQAIVIVIVVLMLFMGLRSGLIIGAVLLITILATLIVMRMMEIDLQRISLGALIIALGMLVDNAIVVTDGILVRVSRGMDRIKAANEVVTQTATPLLGATIIAVLAFVPIGFSADNTGEYTRSLFLVMLISLMLSWITALTLTPLLCHMYIKPERSSEGAEPYGGWFYNSYRALLRFSIRVRYLTLLLMLVLLAAAVYGFGLLKAGFFPSSSQPQFTVHYWMPQGSDIRATSQDMKVIERYVSELDGITGVSSYIGAGALRFQLTYGPEDSNPSYGLLIADVDDYKQIPALAADIYTYIRQHYPDAQPVISKFELGPGSTFKVRARFSGPDTVVLRELADQAIAIIRTAEPQIVMTDWREPIKVLAPQFSEAQARRTGITREQLANTVKSAFDGLPVGLYREGNKLIPIISLPPPEERRDVDSINDIQIWSDVAQLAIPLRQVVSGFDARWDDGIIKRRDRVRTIEVRADAFMGELASDLLARIKPDIEAIDLPPGYKLEWGGEYEDSARAQSYIAAGIPVPVMMMVLILVLLFNNLRQPLVVLLTVPLAIIGVSVGLLLANEPFGFMAMLGFLSLSGMLIKNAIVLIDQINQELSEGRTPLNAVIESGVSRMRPVAMAAATTVLGMIPLFKDPFYIGMAVTIIGGLSFATVLTLLIVPVLYATVYRIPSRSDKNPSAAAGVHHD